MRRRQNKPSLEDWQQLLERMEQHLEDTPADAQKTVTREQLFQLLSGKGIPSVERAVNASFADDKLTMPLESLVDKIRRVLTRRNRVRTEHGAESTDTGIDQTMVQKEPEAQEPND